VQPRAIHQAGEGLVDGLAQTLGRGEVFWLGCSWPGLPQTFLCVFQSAFWQSREQYCVEEHLAHRLSVTAGGDFLQDSQAAMVTLFLGDQDLSGMVMWIIYSLYGGQEGLNS
jgi:hypothetical protein